MSIALHAGAVFGQSQSFKLVIDPGHGGRDPGSLGTGRYKNTEKDIALRVALKLGALIQKNMSDVRVHYTRKTDRFVTLRDRSRMANKEKANLFLSIHCNSSKFREPYGSETYVMGLHKADSNFEIAKRENSVIYLEADYRKAYEGFDPSSPDSYIGLTLVQNQNLAQSLKFADYVEDTFRRDARRSDRGVKQAGFWVISKNIIPSVLVELGFLTNRKEERYLNSEKGQNQMAHALYRAFREYKADIDTRSAAVVEARLKARSKALAQVKNLPAAKLSKGIIYGVQLCAVRHPTSVSDAAFKSLHPIRAQRDGAYFRYVYGVAKTPEQAYTLLARAIQKGFEQAFLVAYRNGKPYERYYDNKLPAVSPDRLVQAARKRVLKAGAKVAFKVQFYSSSVPLASERRFQSLKGVSHYAYRGRYAYTSGNFSRYNRAIKRLHELREKGYKDAFLIAFQGDERISLTLARELMKKRLN